MQISIQTWRWLLIVVMGLLPGVSVRSVTANEALPPIIFVARAHLASPDYIFRNDLGPPGQLTTSIDAFAPGSKLMLRDPDGTLRVLLDTLQPVGHELNPLGLKDLAAPDVSFDATRIVFAGTFGPEPTSALGRPRFSWRLFELTADRKVRQLTFSDRLAQIPAAPGNAEIYGYYDDLSPAYLADGRIVFSSSRYPSRSHYDGRPTFNLYTIGADGANMRRITTERGGALHPTPLPDGRILWSRWWVNFNQPSELGIYQRIDNGEGRQIARDRSGQPVTIERQVQIASANAAPNAAAPIIPTATPWRPTFVERLDPASGSIIRITVTPAPRLPAPAPTRIPAATRVAGTSSTTVRIPITGYQLPDGTLVYSNTNTTFLPARGRLPDGSPIRDAPNTWHLMSIQSDGSDMQRYAWTPRYQGELTSDDGQDTFNAAQPALVFVDGRWLVAYTSQRDGTMAHTSLLTGIRIAVPGIAGMVQNTNESIAGMRWELGNRATDGNALRPVGLPDGRIVFSQSVPDSQAVQKGVYRYNRAGKMVEIALHGAALRYELRIIAASGAHQVVLPMKQGLAGYDALDAKPLVVRSIGNLPGQWQLPQQPLCEPNCPQAASDDPMRWNTPRGLVAGDGKAAYSWSPFQIGDVKLALLHNPNVYANPPLSMPYLNNSPPIGSVAFADIYIDAPQFTGSTYNANQPDDQVRAVKWLTVPVGADGSFTASVPADTPTFIVLRDKAGRVVRGANRSSLAIAQGNAPAQVGQVVRCTGCHIGHVSGSLAGVQLAEFGWTNVAPAAEATVSSGSNPERLIDRRGYILAETLNTGAVFQDRSPSWMAAGSRGEGESIEFVWQLPIAIREANMVAPEPGQEGFSQDYKLSGELRFFLNGVENVAARQVVTNVQAYSRGGTSIRFDAPIAADRMVFFITNVAGKRNGVVAPAALAEIEVLGQAASPQALQSRPMQVMLPDIGK